jgi:hypothetical protein
MEVPHLCGEYERRSVMYRNIVAKTKRTRLLSITGSNLYSVTVVLTPPCDVHF